jgi:hypothetical protein
VVAEERRDGGAKFGTHRRWYSLPVTRRTPRTAPHRIEMVPWAAAAAASLAAAGVLFSEALGAAVGQSDASLMTARFADVNTTERLLFIGQDLDSIGEYVDCVRIPPHGFTTYTAIRDSDAKSLDGLYSVAEYGAGPVDASALLRMYPNASLNLGLNLVGSLPGIVAGRRDHIIDRLGEFIAAAGRPIYLRIGYEFDGPWNAYEPEAYKSAYRRIVTRLRERGAHNFFAVWHSAASSMGTHGDYDISSWWPGDDVVDMCGLSYFMPYKEGLDGLLSLARAKAKPVMIAESAPQGWDLASGTVSSMSTTGGGREEGADPRACWGRWYEPYFAFIDENSDVIKVVCYISCNWEAQSMWTSHGESGVVWGDTRVSVNPGILKRWTAEISRQGWAHPGPSAIA